MEVPMGKALAFVSALSLLFAVVFAAGGAGIYGSPFAAVADKSEQGLMLLTILAGPVACLAAIAIYQKFAFLASLPLLGGAICGAFLGSLTKFSAAGSPWEWVFALFVWAPMVMLALALWSPKPARDLKRGAAVWVAVVTGFVGLVMVPPASRSTWLGVCVAVVSGLIGFVAAWWVTHGPEPLAGTHPVDLKDGNEGKATASLMLGLFSILAGLIPYIAVPTAIAGVVLGLMGLGPQRRRTAIAGIVLSVVYLVLVVLIMACIAYLVRTGQWHIR
jgi:Ca2+/Na+ antiporter